MNQKSTHSVRRVAKAAGVGLMAGGLLLGGPAATAFADNAVGTAVGALGTTVDKAVAAGGLATNVAAQAAVGSANTAVKAGANALTTGLRGLFGH
jgi:hypothetical protein